MISLNSNADAQLYIREIGRDFNVGDKIDGPRRLTPALVALAASMNAPDLTVSRKPKVALIATGNELVIICGVLDSKYFATWYTVVPASMITLWFEPIRSAHALPIVSFSLN